MKQGSKRKKIALLMLALGLVASLACLAACAPQAQKDAAQSTEATDTAATEAAAEGDVDADAATTILPGDFQNPGAGDFTEGRLNKTYVNDANRGCNSCHADLWDVMSDLSPIQHVLSSPAGYGQTYNINDCMSCHHYNLQCGGPKLSEFIHNTHYSNAQFTDTQNGTCWSCHATTNDGEMVLWDTYKYSSELGGYLDTGDPSIQTWLDMRQWNNASMVDVVCDPEPAIDVELSQPVSDEKDMFVADNYIVPELKAEDYELKVVGANEERTFTLADLQAMPQTEMTVTQDCLTNAINGVMVGNIPVKGVLLKDFIEACGGVPEDVTTVMRMGADGWGHPNTLDFLLEQNAIIALQFWGHDLTVDQGYPVTLVVPGVGGTFWTKWMTSIEFGNVEGAFTGTWPLKEAFPDGFQGVMCSGWFAPGEDGQEVKVGEPVTINGYAYQNANMGHTMTQVAFSADYGKNWTTIDVPADFDQNQWVYWEGTWTPEKAGTYVLHVKPVDSQGVEPYRPASVIVKVTE